MSDRAILLTCIASAVAAYGVVAIGLPAWTAALLAAAAAAEFGLRSRRDVREAKERVEHELQRTLRWREEQLANTAHELRTPLTAVATALELLREGVASTEDERAQFLDQATTASRHMAFLIHDVVDLAAIEGNRIRLQMRECRVRDLLLDVKKVMELSAQTHGVTLAVDDVDERVAVYADRGRFLQIAFNLVSNALKHSGSGATVRIAVAIGRSQAHFEVHDSGPGIDQDRRSSLFTRFGSASGDSDAPGTGLGLYVSSMLTARMGGAIGFHPGAERGSVFWFSLPLSERQRPTAAPLPATTANETQVPSESVACARDGSA
jgi:signal transduction histidine kinase